MPLSRNLGTLTSWNPLGLSRPVTEIFFFSLQVVNRLLQYHPSTNSLPDQRRELKTTGTVPELSRLRVKSGMQQEAAEKLQLALLITLSDNYYQGYICERPTRCTQTFSH